jgi:hypothetical protein
MPDLFYREIIPNIRIYFTKNISGYQIVRKKYDNDKNILQQDIMLEINKYKNKNLSIADIMNIFESIDIFTEPII